MTDVFRIEDHPLIFMKPRIAEPHSWVKHIPFAYLAVELVKPRLLVELGTHSGNSYLAFCQAVERLGLDTECVAVDSWKGDDHAQSYGEAVYESLHAYHQPRYSGFSRLLRKYFDDAVDEFTPGSIDLLHIDGLHTYEAVKHDFETWLPKLSDRAVVLFHDVAVRERGFGVWRFFEEICQHYEGISFEHGNGLGVLLVGANPPGDMIAFIESFRAQQAAYQTFFEALGSEVEAGAGARADLATVPTDCRLYFRAADEEYAEERQICLSRDGTSGLSLLRFGLPEGARLDFIRIDPAESPGIFGLVRVALAREDGTLLAEVEGLSGRVVDIGGERLPARDASQVRWAGIGRDPSVELNVADVAHPIAGAARVMEVTIAYEAVLEDALAIRVMDTMAQAIGERTGRSSTHETIKSLGSRLDEGTRSLAELERRLPLDLAHVGNLIAVVNATNEATLTLARSTDEAIKSLGSRLDEGTRSLAELERRLPLDFAHLGNLIAVVNATSEATLALANKAAPEIARTSADTQEAVEGIAALHERIRMESSGVLAALATLQHAANGSAQYNLDSRVLTESIVAHVAGLEQRMNSVDGFSSSLEEVKNEVLQLRAELAPARDLVERRRWWRWW